MNAAVSQAIVLILGSLGLGLVLTLPMLSMTRFGYLLLRLRQRQQTEIGKLAYPPLMLSYVEDQRLQTGLFLTPVCVNTLVIFGLIGLGNWWYWGAVFIVETLGILIYQQFRCRRLVDDAYAYLEMTAPGNGYIDGLITDQAVSLEEQDAANWGRVIQVLGFEAGHDDRPRLFFVTFPFEERRRVREIPESKPVRIFFCPSDRFDALPHGVMGSVVGVQSIRSDVSGGNVDWWGLFAARAHHHR